MGDYGSVFIYAGGMRESNTILGPPEELLGSLCGVCRPVLQILTPFQTKRYGIFHTRFQTWPLKSISVFRPGL